jgi:hypothetical protein
VEGTRPGSLHRPCGNRTTGQRSTAGTERDGTTRERRPSPCFSGAKLVITHMLARNASTWPVCRRQTLPPSVPLAALVSGGGGRSHMRNPKIPGSSRRCCTLLGSARLGSAMTAITSPNWVFRTDRLSLRLLIPTHKVTAPLSAFLMRTPTTARVPQERAIVGGRPRRFATGSTRLDRPTDAACVLPLVMTPHVGSRDGNAARVGCPATRQQTNPPRLARGSDTPRCRRAHGRGSDAKYGQVPCDPAQTEDRK